MSNSVPGIKHLLSELIAEPSVSCASPQWDMSNQGVVNKLAQWFTDLQFNAEVVEVPGFPGKYNMIATRGTGDGGLVLSGHTDTVPFDEKKWTSDPLRLSEKDNRFYGIGTCDMKGFFPLVAEAVKSFSNTDFKRPLVILATADEESSMCGARALCAASFSAPRAALIGEPTGLSPIRMHKGIMMESVRITGKSGHSSNPALGNNALDCMYQVLGKLIEYRQYLQSTYRNSGFEIDYPTLNLGHIHGGDNPNRICGACELQFDLRPLPGMPLEDLRHEITAMLLPIAKAQGVELEIVSLFPGVDAFETVAESALVKLCEKLTGTVSESVAFATEAPFLQHLGMETIVLGAGSIDQAHQPDEYLAFDQIDPMVNILKQMIQHYCL